MIIIYHPPLPASSYRYRYRYRRYPLCSFDRSSSRSRIVLRTRTRIRRLGPTVHPFIGAKREAKEVGSTPIHSGRGGCRAGGAPRPLGSTEWTSTKNGAEGRGGRRNRYIGRSGVLVAGKRCLIGSWFRYVARTARDAAGSSDWMGAVLDERSLRSSQ